jgi:hypothetical protein
MPFLFFWAKISIVDFQKKSNGIVFLGASGIKIDNPLQDRILNTPTIGKTVSWAIIV